MTEETFMKFLATLGGGLSSLSGYNPSLKVKESGGGSGAAPWWSRTAFSGQRNRLEKEMETSKLSEEYKQKSIDSKLTRFDSQTKPNSYTNDRERVAAKIAAASKKWKMPQ